MSDEKDNQDDKDLFRSLFGNIEPVKNDLTPEWRVKPSSKPRRRVEYADHDEPAISPWPDLEDITESDSYRANGLQNKLVSKLRRGKLPPQASLDLHGMTRDMALPELLAFIEACQSRGINCIRIVHGKGHQSEDGKAILKPSVAIWLKQMPTVLAYCPALPNDGGQGALYVLLKRSSQD